ncbi:MAG: hypothetical protein SGI77_17625 [Pirellulaceae bacterium]|nr:hypothetical protein [Pirellulaceae bacterium]
MQSVCSTLDWSAAVDLVNETCLANIKRWGSLPDRLEIGDVVSAVYLLLREEFGVQPSAALIRREVVRNATNLYLKRTRDASWRRRKRRPTARHLGDITQLDAIASAEFASDIGNLKLSGIELRALEMMMWENGNLSTIDLGKKLGVPHQRASEVRRAVRRKLEEYFLT